MIKSAVNAKKKAFTRKRVGIEADGGNMMFDEICIYKQ